MLLDFVPNHASTESDYFIKSEESHPKYKDFFVWADGYVDPENETNMLPPSNWVRCLRNRSIVSQTRDSEDPYNSLRKSIFYFGN